MCSYCSHSSRWFIALLTAVSLGSLRVSAQDDAVTPPAVPAQEQPEVLTRGPVHEAFAEPVSIQTQTGLIVPVQPPAPVDEVPPTERPQGSQFVWIPGYWSWDADRLGYIWVSACWRAAPPKMSWVPGYWNQVSGGWEWVAGFWAPANVQNIEYLPAPPVIANIEPVGIQPSPDTIWVPPCMYWSNGRYVQRAGYWLTAQPNWVWVPSHYVVTPRGYIFAEGHWDYSLERRGVLFAPVYFPSPVYLRAGFTFSPGIVVDLGLLQVNLFAYPRYNHYYFGDYYDSVYLSVGIFPWFECRQYHTWYDPIYEHARWQNRANSHWETHERDEYRRRFDDRALRPAHTFREQEARLSGLPEPQRHASQTVRPLSVTVSSRNTSIKFEKISSDAQHTISRQATAVRTYRDERTRWEAPASGAKTARPVEVHQTTMMPSTEHKQPVAQPARTTESTVKSPDSHQEPAYTSFRETPASRPEQVKIPVSPVVGNSGKSGFFKKGPPTQPSGETKNYRDYNDMDPHRK